MDRTLRMAQAYEMQDASNPIPVARFFAECVADANRETDSNGWIKDPACLIMFDKLRDMLLRQYPVYGREIKSERLDSVIDIAMSECHAAYFNSHTEKES